MTNVVLIGLKGHQSVVLTEIARREDVRLAAVWDDDARALEAFRRDPSVDERTLLTPNLDEVYRLDNVQIAVLCDENSARAANLAACAQRGWDIVAEKPLVIRLEDLEPVRRQIAAAGVRLSMLLTMRFEPIYAAMREAIAGGAVGTPLQLAGQKSYRRGNRPAWQRDPARFGGTIPFIGIHPIDLLHWVTGCRYTRVAALQHNAGLPGAGSIEESCAVLLECEGGAAAAVRLDYLRPSQAPTHGDDRIRVAGSTGVIEAMAGKLTLLSETAPPQELPLPGGPNLFADFLAFRDHGVEPRITAEDCFAMTEVVLKARQAAETAAWVAL